MAGLKIELAQARSWHGVSRFRVSLIESSSNAGDIPSEGEYRCVALADFMAELSIKDSGSGIIFDDPMPSPNPQDQHRMTEIGNLMLYRGGSALLLSVPLIGKTSIIIKTNT
ncbi:hypothetical protein [Aliiroseovarius crassostreae]|uniref:hypothetical protein n=1 Tax=Aliiroseovarius crassostreae TaxID=154981 RepID=UPI0021F9931F|nr:hypothetical protein [Aliiroseovarius crassostreae]UWQ09228.1 hypothetical protein K3X25_06645 [Aliiroseovarius crassostreae]